MATGLFPHNTVSCNDNLLAISVKLDRSIGELDSKHISGLRVIRDGVEFVATLHEDHPTRGLAVGETGLLVVVEEVYPVCRLREDAPSPLPALRRWTYSVSFM